MNSYNILPPVLLLGADSPIGLTVIRELGNKEVPVYGLAWSERGLGLYSKSLSRGFVRENENNLINQINKISKDFDIKHLMAISEDDILFLHRHEDGLRGINLLIPDALSFARVINKNETFKVAKCLGIRVPTTWELEHSSKIDDIAHELNFPIVLKWSNPVEVREKLNKIGLSVEKLRYIYSLRELKCYFEPLDIVSEYPMIQEFVPGHGLGQMFNMYEGEAVLTFQHKRIAEWPPEGGVSAVCESINVNEHKELQHKSTQLLKELNWSGPAMVEYRYDSKTNEAVLMEINGRFWGSLPLASKAGAHFAWSFYACNVLSQVPTTVTYRADVVCRFFVPEIKRLLVILFKQQDIQNRQLKFEKTNELIFFIARYFRSRHYWYVFSLEDPKPFFKDMQYIIKKIFNKIIS